MLRCICSFNHSLAEMKGSESDDRWLGFARSQCGMLLTGGYIPHTCRAPETLFSETRHLETAVSLFHSSAYKQPSNMRLQSEPNTQGMFFLGAHDACWVVCSRFVTPIPLFLGGPN